MAQPMFYPELSKLTKTNLAAWKELIAKHPDYFDNPDCPYSHEDIQLLKSIFINEKTQQQKEDDLDNELYDDGEDVDFEAEALKLYKDMRGFKNTLGNTNTSEKATTFRTMVSLMEKILDQQERASGIKHFTAFKDTIFDTLDRYLTPQQIHEFMEDVQKTLQLED